MKKEEYTSSQKPDPPRKPGPIPKTNLNKKKQNQQQSTPEKKKINLKSPGFNEGFSNGFDSSFHSNKKQINQAQSKVKFSNSKESGVMPVSNSATTKATKEQKGVNDLKNQDILNVNDSAKVRLSPDPNSVTTRAINDGPSNEDKIGFAPYVKSLSRMILHKETATPLTIGIYGPWGTGKTSFMRQVEVEINRIKDKKYQVAHVRFDAWKHEVSENLWASLLQTIPTQIEKQQNLLKRIWGRIKYAIYKVDTVSWVYFTILLLLGLVLFTYYKLFLTKLGFESVTDFWKWLSLIPILPIILGNSLRDFFSRLFSPLGINVDQIINGRTFPSKVDNAHLFAKDLKFTISTSLGKKGRLILYIDDLDRCSPQNIVEVIESINVFLDSKQCIFILGMDHDKIAKCIGNKYSQLINNNSNCDYATIGKKFLEKIVQLPITLPRMSSDDLDSFAKTILPSEENLSTKKRIHESKKEQEKAYYLEDIPLSKGICADLDKIFHYIHPRSPRNIKRFMNRVWFFYLLYHISKPALKEEYLAFWIYLQYQFPADIKKIKKEHNQATWKYMLIDCHDSQYQGIVHLFSDIKNAEKEKSSKDSKKWYEKYVTEDLLKPYLRFTDCVDSDI